MATIDITFTTSSGLVIDSGTTANVFEGGVLKDSFISSGGRVRVYDVGTVSSTTVYDFGELDVNEGGKAIYDIVSSGGVARIQLEGVASYTIVSNGGEMRVYNNGAALFATVSNGGSMVIWNKGHAESATLKGGSVFVRSGGTANSTTVSKGGAVFVSSGGTANATVVSSRGTVYVYDGGSADATVVSSRGAMTISSGGIVDYTTIEAGGSMIAMSGGTANYTTVSSGGSITISDGGFTYYTTVSSGGYIRVSSGGLAMLTFLRGGAYAMSGGMLFVVEPVSGGVAVVYNGGSAKHCGINSGGTMLVSSGGVADNINVSGGGTLTFLSCGAGSGATVMSGGIMNVRSSTEISDTFVSGGTMYVNSASALRTVVQKDEASVVVYSKGRVESTTTKSGKVYIYEGGNAVSTTMILGRMFVSGGTAEDVAIGDNELGRAALYVEDGGKAQRVTVNYGCEAFISNGGVVDSMVVSEYATVNISSGSAGKLTVSSGGRVLIADGGVVSEAVLLHRGSMYVSKGAVADEVTVSAGGVLWVSGGMANAVTVSSGGNLYVSNGGVMDSLTVNRYGNVTIKRGGKITGALKIVRDATVSAYEGAVVDIDISKSAPGAAARLSGISLISGTPELTITVSATQEQGEYALASGAAASFDRSFTVVTDAGAELGTVSVGGTLSAGGHTYRLSKSGSDLTLSVDGAVIEAVKTVAGKFTGAGGVFQLMADGGGVVRTAAAATELRGTLDPYAWELAAVGDFNGDGRDGLVWVEKRTGYAYMQYDMTHFAEVNNKTYCLGVVGEGYAIKAGGDFSGSNIDGVVMQGPAFGDPEVSLNYGLPVWARESDGTTFNGWLGALVNTWEPGDPLKGDLNDPASINANNYKYDIVGVGDFDGDGRDDVMLQNTMPKVVNQAGIDYAITGSGDVFTFLTGDEAAIKAGDPPTVAYAGCATDGWSVVGFGDFDADGVTDALLTNGTGIAGWKMGGGQRTGDFWFGNLATGQSIVGVADVDADGTDDLIVAAADDTMAAWLVKNGTVTGSLALK